MIGCCEQCWFRKGAEPEKGHIAYYWRKDLNNGDCIINSKPCKHEWDTYEKAIKCPVMIKFYQDIDIAHAERIKAERQGNKPNKKSTANYEQLTLF